MSAAKQVRVTEQGVLVDEQLLTFVSDVDVRSSAWDPCRYVILTVPVSGDVIIDSSPERRPE